MKSVSCSNCFRKSQERANFKTCRSSSCDHAIGRRPIEFLALFSFQRPPEIANEIEKLSTKLY